MTYREDKQCHGCGRWFSVSSLDIRGHCQDCGEAFDAYQQEKSDERRNEQAWEDEHG